MNNVAGQNDEAGRLKMNQQRLVALCVPGRGKQRDAAIAEYIGITVDELKALWLAQELAGEGHQLMYIIVRPVGGMYPAVLSSLRQNCGVGEQRHVTYVISMGVRYGYSTDVARLQVDFGELICE